jgi:TIR domain
METETLARGAFAPEVEEEYHYWAFISYSHQDAAWARWLHEALETYRVPRRLVGRRTRFGSVPRRLFPVFRDREELPGAADLGEQIRTALRRSRALILICSPRSAVSHWVNEEVRSFKAMGRAGRVLCLIVDGEPNAGDKPECGLLECFPPAARFAVGPEGALTQERTEAIAADARRGKDGKVNALLKLLAGLLEVGYDELKQRERQRRRWRRMRLGGVAALLAVAFMVDYAAMADRGFDLPAGEAIRLAVDRGGVSLYRPVHRDAEVRQAAATLRRKLLARALTLETPSGALRTTFKSAPAATEVWCHSQLLAGILAVPDLPAPELGRLTASLRVPFAPGMRVERHGVPHGWIVRTGWSYIQAEPALWTATALALGLGREGWLTGRERERALTGLRETQAVLRSFRPTDFSGGWNMFPRQTDAVQENPYTTALALQALLETRRAGLPWDGSAARRDALIAATAGWLVRHFDPHGSVPGWNGGQASADQALDGLTLQIDALLLRAEAEAGVPLPPALLAAIPRHLARCAERTLAYPNASTEFTSRLFTAENGAKMVGNQVLAFLWYPWAIQSCTRWLERAQRCGAPPEHVVRVRRALGHLIVDLGDEAITKASSGWAYVAGEHLYALAAVAAGSRRG